MHLVGFIIRIFHFVFDLLWRGRVSSVRSVAFLGSRELK